MIALGFFAPNGRPHCRGLVQFGRGTSLARLLAFLESARCLIEAIAATTTSRHRRHCDQLRKLKLIRVLF